MRHAKLCHPFVTCVRTLLHFGIGHDHPLGVSQMLRPRIGKKVLDRAARFLQNVFVSTAGGGGCGWRCHCIFLAHVEAGRSQPLNSFVSTGMKNQVSDATTNALTTSRRASIGKSPKTAGTAFEKI